MLSRITSFALFCALTLHASAQSDCEKRSFIINTSLDQSGFTVQTYGSDLLDSLYWDFGDGETYKQTSDVGTGAAVHTYSAPGTYTVTLERWGVKDFPQNTTPLHCTFSLENVIYDHFTDSMCGGDFLTFTQGNTVTFSNRSVIHAPAFNSHSTEPLWDFGNGTQGIFINRIYEVTYEPGTYTACLYYNGFSFNDGGYFYDCETCKTFTVGPAQGLEELSAGSFSLYPNPSATTIELTSTERMGIGDITLLDGSGRSFPVTASTSTGLTLRLNVEELAPGTYWVRVRTANAVKTLPFVKL